MMNFEPTTTLAFIVVLMSLAGLLIVSSLRALRADLYVLTHVANKNLDILSRLNDETYQNSRNIIRIDDELRRLQDIVDR